MVQGCRGLDEFEGCAYTIIKMEQLDHLSPYLNLVSCDNNTTPPPHDLSLPGMAIICNGLLINRTNHMTFCFLHPPVMILR